MARKSGISASNLMLMGGLAALVLDRNLRDRVVGTTRSAYGQGRELLEDEVMPALSVAAAQAERRARHLAHEGQRALHDWQQDEAPDLLNRAQGFLETASERAARLAAEAQKEWQQRAEQAGDALQDTRKDVRRSALALADQGEDALKQARRTARRAGRQGEDQLEDLQGTFLSFLGRTGDELEDRRRQMQRDLSRARRDAERELRSTKRHWQAQQLERAIEKKVAPFQKMAEREFGRFEKDVLKQKRLAERQARAEGGLSGGVVLLGLLGGAAVALARMPEARTAVLEGVEKVSPDARHHLERVGRSFKASVGEMWIEGPKPSEGSPAPTGNKSVAATGDASKDTGNPRTGGQAPADIEKSADSSAQGGEGKAGQTGTSSPKD